MHEKVNKRKLPRQYAAANAFLLQNRRSMGRKKASFSNDYVFKYKFVEVHGFGEVAGQKAHRVELGIVENVRLHQHGSAYIKPLADVCKIGEKAGIAELFIPFVCQLFNCSAVFYNLRPNSEHSTILLNTPPKVNGFDALY